MIKRLLSCVREYKKASILAPLYICIEVILDVLIPWLMADMIDKGFYANGGRGDLGYVIKNGIILLIIAAASMVFGALCYVLWPALRWILEHFRQIQDQRRQAQKDAYTA